MTDRHAEGLEKAADAVVLAQGSITAGELASRVVAAYLEHTHPVVDSVEADRLPGGSVIRLRDGTVRLATGWGSGWASSSSGDDHPLDQNGDFPARVLHWGDR